MAYSPSGTGFVNFERILGLNQESATGMANKLNAPIQQGIGRLGDQMGTIESEVQNILRGPQEAAADFDINQHGAFNSAGTELGKLQGALGLLSDPAGRGAALRDVYGQGAGYTPGSSRFDSALAGAGGAGLGMKDAITGLQKRWSTLRDNTQSTVAGIKPPAPQPTAPKTPTTITPGPVYGGGAPTVSEDGEVSRAPRKPMNRRADRVGWDTWSGGGF